jgi:glycosyltransferase involved in cell wall biosynthesis
MIGGRGDSGYRDWVERCAGSNVRILDRIEDRRLLASAFAGADAFAFPSWVEGAPLVAIEAGLAGTPLVLSSMSSEREYFGTFGEYVHPADLHGIARALSRLVANPESAERRAQRAAFCRERYAFDEHAQHTLAMYREALARPRHRVPVRSDGAPLVMDASALVHFLMAKRPFTGVPTVEFNVLRALARRDVDLKTVVFFGAERGFCEVSVADLLNFDKSRFIAKYYSEPTARDNAISYLEVAWPGATTDAIEALPALKPALRRSVAALAKHGLRRMPAPLLERVTAVVRKFRPDFDPYVVNPAHKLTSHWKAAARSGFRRIAHAGKRHRALPPPISSLLHARRRPAPVREAIPVGARLLTLGHGWLSNEALLHELVRMVRERRVALEPYVYDLSYHTGAHFSGWSDNRERFERLLTLLQHSSRVYTECGHVETELEKLKAARGLAFKTVRTGLSVRDMPPADRKGLPPLKERSFVLYVSSFTKRKNHDFLVSVWRELHTTYLAPKGSDVTLLLIGEIQEESQYGNPVVERELERTGIRILREVSDSQLTWLYENCLFTAYPSLMEGWGIPVQESIAKGKVCLASTEVPVTQEIGNPAVIRLRPHDFYGWYEALKTWISNERLRAAFEDEARRYRPPSWDDIALAFLTPQTERRAPRQSMRGLAGDCATDEAPSAQTPSEVAPLARDGR